MFRPYEIGGWVKLPDGTTANGHFVVFARSQRAAVTTARLHLTMRLYDSGLTP